MWTASFCPSLSWDAQAEAGFSSDFLMRILTIQNCWNLKLETEIWFTWGEWINLLFTLGIMWLSWWKWIYSHLLFLLFVCVSVAVSISVALTTFRFWSHCCSQLLLWLGECTCLMHITQLMETRTDLRFWLAKFSWMRIKEVNELDGNPASNSESKGERPGETAWCEGAEAVTLSSGSMRVLNTGVLHGPT